MTDELLNTSIRLKWSFVCFSHIHTWWLVSLYAMSLFHKVYNLQKSSHVIDLQRSLRWLLIISWIKFKTSVLGFLDSSNSWSSPPHYMVYVPWFITINHANSSLWLALTIFWRHCLSVLVFQWWNKITPRFWMVQCFHYNKSLKIYHFS